MKNKLIYSEVSNNMKKILTFIVTFIFFVMPVKAYADSATIEIVVNGQVKKGQ